MQDNPFRHDKAKPVPEVAASALEKTLPLRINGKPYFHDGDPQMPLLWYLRDVLHLTGAKYGCGIGNCGACTVLIDGRAKPACMASVKSVSDHDVMTIEGLAGRTGLHPLQQAWIDEDAIMCGYCQSGQIMAAAELLARTKKPGDQDIDKISNLCRCGSYPRIRRAIKRAAAAMQTNKK